MPQTVYKMPKLDSQLIRKCLKLKEEYTGVLEEDLMTDSENARLAGLCRVRHNALVNRIEELQ